MKNISAVDFIRRVIKKSELGKSFRLLPFQEKILDLAFAFDDNGRLSYDTVIYSCPKKSGKTTLNAALTLWWTLTKSRPTSAWLWRTIWSRRALEPLHPARGSSRLILS